MWLLARLLVVDLVRQVWPAVVGMVLALVVLAVTVVWSLGVMAQPAGIFWLASQAPPEVQAKHPLVPQLGESATPAGIARRGAAIPIGETAPVVVVPAGFFSPVDRARLAIAAGWTGQDLITSVAVSMAENGSGNPALVSPPNKNAPPDSGLWQVNGSWGPQFGGVQALLNPTVNATAAFWVWSHTSGWMAWCTYEPPACGGHGNGAYRAHLSEAAGAVRLAMGG